MGKLATIYAEKRGFKVILHLLYWLMAGLFLNLFFGYRGSIYYIFVILLITAGASYWIIQYLIPRYLFRGRYVLFFIYLLFTIIVSLDMELITLMLFLVYVEKLQFMMMDHNSRDIFSLLAGTYFIVFLSAGIKLTEYWFHEQQRKQDALREKVETELKLLKSQIHPHFLFNTLNNIYALALQKSDRTPDAIIKLSSLLDYLIYHGENELVPLQKEIELLEHYLDLEKLRYGNRLEASFDKVGVEVGIMIAPVLLLPFVENAFKHGVSRSRNQVRIKIQLVVSNGDINFRIENSKPLTHPAENEQGGVGLENLRRRLDILYRGKHSLEILDKEDMYAVSLQLNLGD